MEKIEAYKSKNGGIYASEAEAKRADIVWDFLRDRYSGTEYRMTSAAYHVNEFLEWQEARLKQTNVIYHQDPGGNVREKYNAVAEAFLEFARTHCVFCGSKKERAEPPADALGHEKGTDA